MSKGREIRCYDYVNQPYEKVRDALRDDALAVAGDGVTIRCEGVLGKLVDPNGNGDADDDDRKNDQ